MTQESRSEVLLRWGVKRRNMQWDIRGAAVVASAFRFLYGCAEACLLPFLTIYMRRLGLAASMVGVIMGTKHLVSLVCGPASAFLARRHDRRRVVVTVSLLGSAAACLVFLLIPSAVEQPPSPLCNDTSGPAEGAVVSHELGDFSFQASSVTPSPSSITNLSLGYDNTVSYKPMPSTTVSVPETYGVVNMSSAHSHEGLSLENHTEYVGFVSRNPEANVSLGQNASQTLLSGRVSRSADAAEEWNRRRGEFLGGLKVMDPQHQLFFLLLLAVSLWVALTAPLDRTAADGLYEYLDFVDATDRHRATQAWAFLGGAFGACGAGLLVSRLACLVSSSRAIHFYGYTVLAGLALPTVLLLPMYRHKKQEAAGKMLKALRLVRGHPRALLCALTVFLAGAARSVVSDFLFWQMQDQGSSELHMGLALTLDLLSQLTFNLFSRHLPRFLTVGRALSAGTACLTLQCLYSSFLWGPWTVLPVQPLVGLGVGALWWAVHEVSEDIATPGTERHVLGIFQVMSAGLGGSLGSFSGGLVVQRFGVPMLFRGAAVVLALWTLGLPILQYQTPHQRRINYSQLLTADTSEASDSESDQDRDWLAKAMHDDKTNNNNW
ncbi:major facilitator superfamily domain-containing protein 6-like [Brienomyrus brachyistius]|uniref:major facilitator superfamily domain-containing protein 6-like n=1 Tax=Brienomyrus brachyistius TaxID=42636 RepID=UPI0020B3D68B|nr:major facilitator superfamily domain-containing protein 6-like [Brienomyrus brachyistius]